MSHSMLASEKCSYITYIPFAGTSTLLSEVGRAQIYLETSLFPSGISKPHITHQYNHWYLNHWGCKAIAAAGGDLVKESLQGLGMQVYLLMPKSPARPGIFLKALVPEQ